MAFVQGSKWDEEENQFQTQSTIPGPPSQQPGSPMSPTGAPRAAPTPGRPSWMNPQSGGPQAQGNPQTGNYPSLMGFVRANKDKGAGLAEKVTSHIGGQVNAAQEKDAQARNQWETAARGQAEQQYKDWNKAQDERAKEIRSRSIDVDAGDGRFGEEGSSFDTRYKEAVAARDKELAALQAEKFTPKDIAGYSPDADALAEAKRLEDMMGRAESKKIADPATKQSERGALLREVLGEQQGLYSPMMSELDAAIMGKAAPGFDSQLKQQYGGTLGALRQGQEFKGGERGYVPPLPNGASPTAGPRDPFAPAILPGPPPEHRPLDAPLGEHEVRVGDWSATADPTTGGVSVPLSALGPAPAPKDQAAIDARNRLSALRKLAR
jgi:hypothetical protein